MAKGGLVSDATIISLLSSELDHLGHEKVRVLHRAVLWRLWF